MMSELLEPVISDFGGRWEREGISLAQSYVMEKMSAEEVEEQCREILEDRRADRRYILTTSGPDVALDTPQENIHAMRRAAESFGKGE